MYKLTHKLATHTHKTPYGVPKAKISNPFPKVFLQYFNNHNLFSGQNIYNSTANTDTFASGYRNNDETLLRVNFWRTMYRSIMFATHLESIRLGDGAARLTMQLQQLVGQQNDVIIVTSRLHLVTVEYHRLHFIQLLL